MFAKQFGEWVVRYRWWIILLVPLLVVAAASGARHLTFTTDYRVFFGDDNPQLQAFEALQNTYTKNDNVMFAIAPKDGKVFTRGTLAAVKELTDAAWQVPYSSRVDSITNYQHTRAFGDDLVVEDLVESPADLSDAQLDEKKQIALAEPLLINRLIAPDAAVTAVNVTINLPEKSIKETPEVAAFVRDLADQVRADHPDVAIYISGMTMLNNAFGESAESDMATLTPLMYGVIILVMIFLLRSFSGTLGTVLIMGFSVATAMGIAGWTGFKFTAPSASAPTIILTLAVAHSIHILVSMFHELRNGKSKHAAIAESIRINLQPVFLTSLTTTVGFLSMNFSDVPPFHDLGNMVAIGVLVGFLYSVFFLPAFMAVIPVRVKARPDDGHSIMERFADFVIRSRRMLFWGMAGIIAIFVAGTTQIEINEEWVSYFDERYEFRTDTDFISNHLTGLYLVEYSVPAASGGGISEPEYLSNLEKFANWYREQPETLHVAVLTDTMKRLNKNLHGDDPDWYRIPDNRELSAQYLLLYELSLPYGLDLNNQINVDKSASRMSVTLRTGITSDGILAVEKRAATWMENNLPASMQAHAASPAIMFAHIMYRNIRSMLAGTAFALILISFILVVAVRSVRIGLVSLVPNLVPTAMAFGLWGLTVGMVGMGTSIVASISLGIVVDDTVHFLTKYLRARREHALSAVEAVRYAFRTVGTALWTTSIILAGGFMIMALSGFKMNSQMGILTGIALVFALLADFLFLPPLLMWLDKSKEPATQQPVTESST